MLADVKHTLPLVLAVALVGCASDPMVTGKPQDWSGKPAADLKTAWGEPTRIVTQSNGDEVWEYLKTGDVVIPKGESTSVNFGMFRGGSTAGGSGGFSSEKRPEDRTSRVENLWRYKIHKGKITEWYAARIVDGKIVWQDH